MAEARRTIDGTAGGSANAGGTPGSASTSIITAADDAARRIMRSKISLDGVQTPVRPKGSVLDRGHKAIEGRERAGDGRGGAAGIERRAIVARIARCMVIGDEFDGEPSA